MKRTAELSITTFLVQLFCSSRDQRWWSSAYHRFEIAIIFLDLDQVGLN